MTSPSILVIEDDEHIGSTLLRALIGTGYVTRWVRSGRSGLDACRDSEPDLVLLDLGLPDLDSSSRAVSTTMSIPG